MHHALCTMHAIGEGPADARRCGKRASRPSRSELRLDQPPEDDVLAVEGRRREADVCAQREAFRVVLDQGAPFLAKAPPLSSPAPSGSGLCDAIRKLPEVRMLRGHAGRRRTSAGLAQWPAWAQSHVLPIGR
jgi:hypothetical protein